MRWAERILDESSVRLVVGVTDPDGAENVDVQLVQESNLSSTHLGSDHAMLTVRVRGDHESRTPREEDVYDVLNDLVLHDRRLVGW